MMLFSQSKPKLPLWTKLSSDENDPANHGSSTQTILNPSPVNVLIIAFVSLCGFVLGVFCLTVFTRIFPSTSSTTSMTAPTPLTSCGNNLSSALAAGCEFEDLAGAWMPPACIDREINDEFRAFSWKYYADGNGTVEIPASELVLRDGGDEGVYYATQRWHYVHCAYQWRKLHRSWKLGRRVAQGPFSLSDYDHTVHCGTLYEDTVPPEAINARIAVHFYSC